MACAATTEGEGGVWAMAVGTRSAGVDMSCAMVVEEGGGVIREPSIAAAAAKW